jgi:hypothetical protein
MLEDAIDAYLESVGERAFDEPLLALLRSEGFADVHLVHGRGEFGKDVIGKRDGHQWVFQSKAGNISQGGFRQMTGQLDELRRYEVSHPSFDTSLERCCVLVCTARLTGNGPVSAQQYDQWARDHGEPGLTVWDRDDLRAMLLESPDAVLRGSSDGQLLSMLGAIEERAVTLDRVRQYAERWAGWDHERLASLGIVELGIVAQALVIAERRDLAAHIALAMVWASWAAGDTEDGADVVADAAGGMFETYATPLFELRDSGLVDPLNGLLVQAQFDWASYPVRAIRAAELLSLLALRMRDRDESAAAEVCDLVAELVATHPGCAHPLSDRYATSLIPVVLALHGRYDELAPTLLSQAARWMCDHYSTPLGLAAEDADPEEEVARAFGAGLRHTQLRGRRDSYLASVLLDLAAVLGLEHLYNDIHNDTLVVGAVPFVTLADTADALYRRFGDGVRRLMPTYVDEWPGDGRPVAEHHIASNAQLELEERARYWDQLAVQAVLRDRHHIAVLRAVLR